MRTKAAPVRVQDGPPGLAGAPEEERARPPPPVCFTGAEAAGAEEPSNFRIRSLILGQPVRDSRRARRLRVPSHRARCAVSRARGAGRALCRLRRVSP
jgi:hypothetical protein